MSRSKDPLALTAHWHVDYRIEAELPEDTVVGTRFIVNGAVTVVALAVLLYAGWLWFVRSGLNHQIEDWEARIKENRAEVMDIERLQREYVMETIKIDQAYTLARPHLYVSGLVANLGRTRPDAMSIDLIEWNDSGVLLRGGLREKSEQATRILGSYLDLLRKDEKIGPLFRSIQLTDIDRGSAGGMLRFEIKFVLKDGK